MSDYGATPPSDITTHNSLWDDVKQKLIDAQTSYYNANGEYMSLAEIDDYPGMPTIPANIQVSMEYKNGNQGYCMLWQLSSGTTTTVNFDGIDPNDIPDDWDWPDDGVPPGVQTTSQSVDIDDWQRMYDSNNGDSGWTGIEPLVEPENE